MENPNPVNITVREWQKKLLTDPFRPRYHFAFPYGNGWPGDSNGAFFADGVYHVMFLYSVGESNGTFTNHWGHVSSVDLLHWRQHPDALTVEDGDLGCYSGGAFLDDDGTAYLSFWKFPAKDADGDHGGIMLASSKAPFDVWTRIRPIAIEGNKDPWGTMEIETPHGVEHIGCADPSNIWKQDGWYYMQAGNKCVIDKWGREGDKKGAPMLDPHYCGDWVELFKSKDLKNWIFVHRFYQNDHQNPQWPDLTEDDMCPCFLPIDDAEKNGHFSGKWIQLFISHNHGCQYYIGTLKGETFYPETHGRMSWNDKAYFAPEALVDDKNRLILWTWLADNRDNEYGKYKWAGVYGFPRVLWWADQTLHMAPADELERLQMHHEKPAIRADGSIPVRNGTAFRLKATIRMDGQKKAGFSVRVGSDEKTCTPIYYDKENSWLVMDTSASGNDGWRICEEAPFALAEQEFLSLDIFVDQCVVEVYANERQAICRRVYPENPEDAVGVVLIGAPESVCDLDVWEMAPANQY